MLHTLSVQTLRPKKRCQVNLHMLSHMSVASWKIWLTFTRSMSWGNCAGLPAIHENMMHTLHSDSTGVTCSPIYIIYDYCIYHRFSLALSLSIYMYMLQRYILSISCCIEPPKNVQKVSLTFSVKSPEFKMQKYIDIRIYNIIYDIWIDV